jgi:hypothetical protein
MRSLFLLWIGLAIPLLFYGQAFEGEIVYQTIYTSKMTGVADSRIANAMGDRNEFYVQNGNYKNITNGTVFHWQLYLHADNRLYEQMSNSGAILWVDGMKDKDTVYHSAIRFGAETILGYLCNELTLFCRTGIQKYYFTDKFPADGRLFARHRYGNYADYMSRANAIPLKFIIDTKEFKVESTAVLIKPGHLDTALFTLPPGALLAPGPENE